MPDLLVHLAKPDCPRLGSPHWDRCGVRYAGPIEGYTTDGRGFEKIRRPEAPAQERPAGEEGGAWQRLSVAPAPYCFGEVRVATLALLIFTALSGWRSCGVVTTKFSDHVVTFRSSPTVFADTPVFWSTSTRILSGKPPRAMWSAAMLLGLYRMRAPHCPVLLTAGRSLQRLYARSDRAKTFSSDRHARARRSTVGTAAIRTADSRPWRMPSHGLGGSASWKSPAVGRHRQPPALSRGRHQGGGHPTLPAVHAHGLLVPIYSTWASERPT